MSDISERVMGPGAEGVGALPRRSGADAQAGSAQAGGVQ
jgi:hypothetical protein